MAPARSPRLAALALLGAVGLWACGSTKKSSSSATGGEAGSSAGVTSGGASSGGHAGTPAGGGEAGLSTGPGGAGRPASADAGAGSGGEAPSAGGVGGVAAGGAGVGGECTQPCTTMAAGAFCEQDEVTWVCEPGFDFELFNEQCRDTATALIRYCCPPEFTGECP